MTLLAGQRCNRERDLAVTNATLLPQQNCRHIDLVRTLLRDKDCRMAIGTIQPLGVLAMREYYIRDRCLNRTHDIEIHHKGLIIGVNTIPAWF